VQLIGEVRLRLLQPGQDLAAAGVGQGLVDRVDVEVGDVFSPRASCSYDAHIGILRYKVETCRRTQQRTENRCQGAMIYSGRRRDDPAGMFNDGDGPGIGGVIMSWFVLAIAGLLEVAWAVGLKYTAGFTRLVPSALTLAAMAGSVGLLGLALKDLPLGTAYAVWTGIGTVGTAVYGIAVLGEPAEAARLVCIALIVAGILGLKWLSPH
jgi:quaternary ammonium compound-resistance protein SugE